MGKLAFKGARVEAVVRAAATPAGAPKRFNKITVSGESGVWGEWNGEKIDRKRIGLAFGDELIRGRFHEGHLRIGATICGSAGELGEPRWLKKLVRLPFQDLACGGCA